MEHSYKGVPRRFAPRFPGRSFVSNDTLGGKVEVRERWSGKQGRAEHKI